MRLPDEGAGFRRGVGHQFGSGAEANDVFGPETDAGRPEITWTDDRVELLKQLWADGLSASQIAGELGGITRNAVIGKVHRLGLSGRAKAPPPRCRASASRAPRRRCSAHRARWCAATPRSPRSRPTTTTSEPEIEPIENIIPIGQRCTLLELERREVPLADRRSGPARLLLLRRQDHHGHSLLRLSRARRLPAAGCPARPAAGARVACASRTSLVLPCVTNSGGTQVPPVLFDTLRRHHPRQRMIQ